MFDFSTIPWLETALNYTIGGVSVLAIVVAVIKIAGWLKTNNLSSLVEEFKKAIVSKDIKVSLETIAIKQLAAIKAELLQQQKAENEETREALKSQSAVLTDIADIQLQRKSLLSKEQIESLSSHTEAIRTHKQVAANDTLVVSLDPVTLPKAEIKKTTSDKIFID